MKLALVLAVTLASTSLGCSDEGARAAHSPPPVARCKAGEWQRDDGTCVPAGLPPDMPCPPGEWLRETDRTCIPAGVPPDGCGVGFVHDGDRGCEPILPADPCPPGLMAVPGESACHEIAPCGSGTWGDIPVEPDTEHVDQSYPGADSDGSAEKPWTTIGNALANAAADAIVAIAAGSYGEDVVIEGKPARLWGRCPSMVAIVGTGMFGTVAIYTGASGTEIRSLAVRGDTFGVVLSGSHDVLVERAWVHDNAERGIAAQNELGPTSVTVRSSLVENNGQWGIFVKGSQALVDGTVVRGTLASGAGLFGRGVEVIHTRSGRASFATLRGSLVEHNRDIGVYVAGSDVVVETSVVRDTLPDGDGRFGYGVAVQSSPTTTTPPKLTLSASLVEDNHEVGVFVFGSEAVVESTVVRRTQPGDGSLSGAGMQAQLDVFSGAPSKLTLFGSLVHDNRASGVIVVGSEAFVDATVVRDTTSNGQGLFGRGVQAQSYPAKSAPASLTIRASLVERNQEAGLVVDSSTATVHASLLSESAQNGSAAVGDGILAYSADAPAEVTITATRIAQSARAAVSSFGATVGLGESELVCQAFDLFGTDSGPFTGTIDDLGGNLCGCPTATNECAATGESLQPPQPTGGLE